ncbi:UNVERIFIED_CONTAM: hypothetical protein K2H54_039196 [Gekko kuhli]
MYPVPPPIPSKPVWSFHNSTISSIHDYLHPFIHILSFTSMCTSHHVDIKVDRRQKKLDKQLLTLAWISTRVGYTLAKNMIGERKALSKSQGKYQCAHALCKQRLSPVLSRSQSLSYENVVVDLLLGLN